LANKKIVFSVAAGAFIASSVLMAEDAHAESYKVKSGDSLWSIAKKYETTVSKLKSLNNLSSDIIYPNQVIETDADKKDSNNKNNTNKNKSAKTYTVKPGDTLSEIAYKHDITLKQLMDWNNLDTTLIYPGNTFVVSKGNSDNKNNNDSDSKSKDKNSDNNDQSNDKPKVYTVKAGDTLSGIAAKYKGVSVQNLKKWNNLTSDLIVIGQKLKLSNSAKKNPDSKDKDNSSPAPDDIDYNVDKLIKTANNAIGTPYKWGGSDLSGFDCSGFIHYAYNAAGQNISRLSSDGYHSRAYYVNTPKKGDLVFFENTYRSGISHLGIYVGNNEFIHAGSRGVEKASLNSSYWKKHFEGFKRFY